MWSPRELHSSSSSAVLRSHDSAGRRAEVPSTASSALQELQSDMQSLERRVGKLAKGPLDDAEELLELQKPIESLDIDLAALRQAVRMRFEAVEEHVAALERSSAALEESCDAFEKQRASENGANANAHGAWSSARAAPLLRELRDEVDPAGSSAQMLQRSAYNELSSLTGGRSSRIHAYDAAADEPRWSIREPEPAQRPSRQRSSSPARITRRRSRSPALRSEADFGNGGLEQAGPRMAESNDALSTAPRGPRASFARPAWAAGVELQSEPLHEGRDFVSVVNAIKAAYRYTGFELDQPIEVGTVVLQLRKDDPTLLERYHLGRWKDFWPICQRFVALFMVIPPAQPNIMLTNGDCMLLADVERPYFSRTVKPPDYHEQIAQLCRQVNIPLSAWINRGNVLRSARYSERRVVEPQPPPPLGKVRPWGEARPETQPRPEQQQGLPEDCHTEKQPKAEPKSAAQPRAEPGASHEHISTSFPPLAGPIPVEWETQFDDPTFYWVIVDALRQSSSLSMHLNTLLAAMGRQLGDLLREMITACRGLKRMLGVAARFVKLGMLSNDPQIIVLIDAERPFKEDQDNEDYFARKKSSTQVVTSQQKTVHLRDDPTGWGDDD